MESIAIIGFATITALLTTVLVRKVAVKYGIGTVPDMRKIHVGFIPHMGGLGIYFGGVVGILVAILWKDYYWQMFNFKYVGIFIAATLMLLTGLLDDVRGLRASQKITIQIVASTIVIYSGCKIETIINPFGQPIQLGILSLPLTYLWLIGITNAINLLDGLDGLAAGVSFIAFSTFSVIAFQQQDWMTFGICLAVMGGIIGFLRYNYHPASIFMGDTGSLFLGFLLAAIALKGLQKSQGIVALFIPILTLVVPIGDTALAFFRRLSKGQHPFSPDKDHLHHRLLFLGLSHRQAVHIIYLFSLLFCIAAYLMSTESRFYGLIFLILILLIAIVSLNRLGYLEAQKIKTYLGDQTIIQVKKEMAPLSMRRFWHKFFLIISDFCSLNMVLFLTYWFRFHSGVFSNIGLLPASYYFSSGVWLILSSTFIVLFALNGLYSMRWDVSRFDQVLRTSRVILFGAAIIFLVTLDPQRILSISRLTLLFYTGVLIIFVNLARLSFIYIEKKFLILEYAPHKTLIVGASEKAKKILKEIRKNPHLLYEVMGIIANEKSKKPISDLPYFGTYDRIPQVIRTKGIEEIIIAINEKSRDEILNIVAYGENMRVSFKIIPQMYDVISGHKTEEILGHPLIKLFPEQMRPWQWLGKRVVDAIVGFFAILIFSPLFFLIIILQMSTGIHPFLMIENRVGHHGKMFGLLQFNLAEQKNRISKLLFVTNLYILPHFVNLLLGSMTLVGPKPEPKEVVEELRTKIKFYNRRFMVRPGLTGWAQMKYRYANSLKQKREQFKQDLFYLENMSLLFDFRILLRASFVFLFRH
jgi:UDP-GlcNAc:undecaprenyl-phosphate GlcNAc-1-phosphate transferase